jgi:methionine-rich copper-binding protein CopC
VSGINYIIFSLFFSVIIIIFLCLGINNVFAHITLENKTLATIQELKNARDNVKIQFSYSPERPLIYNETKLIFSIQDLTTGNHIKDLIASITIIKNDRIFFKFNNMAIHNGDLSLKVRFLEDGNYQVINQISSIDNIAVALASFDILVPLQPIGKFNVDSLGQLLIPAGLVAMGLSVSVIALILISRRRRKAEKLESKKYKENKSGT